MFHRGTETSTVLIGIDTVAKLHASFKRAITELINATVTPRALVSMSPKLPIANGDSWRTPATNARRPHVLPRFRVGSQPNCFSTKRHTMREASGPLASLKRWRAAPPLQAWPRRPTCTSVATSSRERLKWVTVIG